MALSNFLENALIDHIFRNRAYTVPTTLYVALFTSDPTDEGTGTEVTGGSYARVQVGPSDSAWESTQGTTAAEASNGTSGATENGAAITFPVPTANWGIVTHFGIFDAVTSGNLLLHGPLTVSKTVNDSDPAPEFAAGDLDITLG